jgi:hypothetical protein
MGPQDYPTEHFKAMAELATALKDLPAQIREHQYSYEAFGSWWVTMRHQGTGYRLVFDGRNRRLALESSSSGDAQPWDKTMWECSLSAGLQLPVAEVVGAIMRLTSISRE